MEIINDLNDFLNKSPTHLHFASNTRRLLMNRKYNEIEENDLLKKTIPKKGFIMLKRKMIIIYEITDSNKSLIVTTSNNGNYLKLFENELIPELIKFPLHDQLDKCKLDENSIKNSEFFLAGSVKTNKNKLYLFQSDEPISIVHKDSAILTISEPTINEYLQNLLHISLDKPAEIEKELFLVPKSSNNFFIGTSESVVGIQNLSTFGISFLALKSFIISSSNSFNKFCCIIPDDQDITKECINSYISRILDSFGKTLNDESIAINIGGIESSWSSHPITPDHRFLSNVIVLQNIQNEIILNQLDKYGIPYQCADNLPIDYSINDIQNLDINGTPPGKLSLPLFNQNGITQYASTSDINNLFNSLFELFNM